MGIELTVKRVKSRPNYYAATRGNIYVHGVSCPVVGIAPGVGAVVIYKGAEISVAVPQV